MGHSKIQTTFDTVEGGFRLARAVSAKENAPLGDGALSGTNREERYVCMCCLWEGGRVTQTPRGALNRVEAVSAVCATPTPTRKTVAAASPVAMPMPTPRTTAAKPSM